MAVETDVKITPAKRRATFKVNLKAAPLAGRVNRGLAVVGATEVRITIEPYSNAYVPKTLAAADALIELLTAVRAELVEQGVES